MTRFSRLAAVGVSALALCLGSSAGIATAAPAGDASPADWNGRCYTISRTSTSFTGWCDGTGPERYGTYVICSGGEYHSTYTRWYGDRRGVYAGCPSGQRRVADGYDHY
ncbi:hypothetical protein [Streptomyces sp. TRM70350]|uniref:hypothetical protein n=1 Tax=Streptomyces sp. TRM70350 TaxID=2856165 RepID=UPI001C48CA5A|nr:hypothetical protein [Streptomyces sp. TRM70350]MBV7700158.1 hypothetical protein [Streptomyces sp. TRM70350]